jgi:hypothetical protein
MTYLLIALGALLGLVLLAHCFCYFFIGKALRNEVGPYLKSNILVTYTRTKWLEFRPSNQRIRAGVIFHPGGYVDPEAYARIFSKVAESGVLCVIVPGPQRTPIANRFSSDKVMAAHPEISHWFIAGHSQGGAVASLYVRDRATEPKDIAKKIVGLIFVGFFVFDRHSLAHRTLPALSVYGSRDGHADSFKPNEKNLPQGAKVICIEGGNHGQFGAYGLHFGDQTPEIERHAQQDIAIEAIKTFINDTLENLKEPTQETTKAIA